MSNEIHSVAAGRFYGKLVEEVIPEERRVGKTLNFGVVYGMGGSLLEPYLLTIKGSNTFLYKEASFENMKKMIMGFLDKENKG